ELQEVPASQGLAALEPREVDLRRVVRPVRRERDRGTGRTAPSGAGGDERGRGCAEGRPAERARPEPVLHSVARNAMSARLSGSGSASPNRWPPSSTTAAQLE